MLRRKGSLNGNVSDNEGPAESGGQNDNMVVVSPPPEADGSTPFKRNGVYEEPALTNGVTETDTPALSESPPLPRYSIPPSISVGQQRRLGGHSRSVSLAGGANSVASPLRNTFVVNGNDHSHQRPAIQAPYRPSHSHGRNLSVSSYKLPSPLSIPNGSSLPSSTTLPNMPNSFGPPSPNNSAGFSANGWPRSARGFGGGEFGQQQGLGVPQQSQQSRSPTSPTSPYLPLDSPAFPPSQSMPAAGSMNSFPSAAAAQHKRRHSRMHSRNLSVFFPRPGNVPESTINEDEVDEQGQDLVIPEEYIPSAGSSVSLPGNRRFRERAPITPLGQGFKFGSRPPPGEGIIPDQDESEQDSMPRTKRRGHHHKHSMSHNFFSFLEPQALNRGGEEMLNGQPTPVPASPWAPISAFPDSARATPFGASSLNSAVPPPMLVDAPAALDNGGPKVPVYTDQAPLSTNLVALAQFALGACMWVVGQQVGSLSVTGLGYWIVFDAMGVWVSRGANDPPPKSLAEEKIKAIRRPYGNSRHETLLMFSQAVYLMFSSVYVCKETVEHLLLSTGGGHGGEPGHHHHSGDEGPGFVGIDFPIVMLLLTLVSILATAFLFDNNAKLVAISGNRLPSLQSFWHIIKSYTSPSTHSRQSALIDSPPTHPLAIVLSNPFATCPLLVSLSILAVWGLVPLEHHRQADLALSSAVAVVTFNVAYRACVVLGAVLLQTSPPKGLPSNKMESFARAMREVERHPNVLHLPAPHVWQLTASSSVSALPRIGAMMDLKSSSYNINTSDAPTDQLVVTVQVHVRGDLGDDEVLELTRWVWEKCVGALGGYKEFREMGEVGGPEVTVGIVRD